MEEQNGTAEAKQLHIIYFLSRKGHDEHPHLIRAHHLCNNGVRLRDIKRWLGELRGESMPQSFAWAYKRRYKTRFVWQDLVDDDIITPISDNEFVLQGSEISCTNDTSDLYKETSQSKKVDEFSSTEIIAKVEQNESNTPSKARFQTRLWSLIGCGGTKTKESAVAAAHGKFNRLPFSSMCSGHPGENARPTEKPRAVARRMCSATKSCDRTKDTIKRQGQWRDSYMTYNMGALDGPNCAICGKMFKPEKLHGHMKSCKGRMKSGPKDNYNLATCY